LQRLPVKRRYDATLDPQHISLDPVLVHKRFSMRPGRHAIGIAPGVNLPSLQV
jgi:hypothetical protein